MKWNERREKHLMKFAFKKSYSLLTFLLTITIVALVVSHVAMMRQLAEAKSEIDEWRSKFGYINVEDKTKIYFSKIPKAYTRSNNAYRIYFPPGHRYMLNLAYTDYPRDGYLDDPTPVKTISLNGWMECEDIWFEFAIQGDGNTRRVIAQSHEGELINYDLKDWIKSGSPTSGNWLDADPQVSFELGQRIPLMWSRDEKTNRGVMLWLEPEADWQARRDKQKAEQNKATSPAPGED
jgi:hypothetical protein